MRKNLRIFPVRVFGANREANQASYHSARTRYLPPEYHKDRWSGARDRFCRKNITPNIHFQVHRGAAKTVALAQSLGGGSAAEVPITLQIRSTSPMSLIHLDSD